MQVTQILTPWQWPGCDGHQWPSISSVSIVLSCTCVSQSESELGRHGPIRGQREATPDQMQRIHHTRTAGDSLPNYFKMSPDIDSKWSPNFIFKGIRPLNSGQPPPPEIILLSNQEALNIRLSHWRDFTQEFVDKSVTLGPWLVAGAGWAGSCDMSCLCLDYDQNILNFNSNNHFDSSWIISHFLTPLTSLRGSSLSLGPLSANEEKLGRGLVLSCLIFITGTGFHARTIFITRVQSSQEVTSREAHYYYPHKKVMMNKNSAEIKISLNIWSSEMYKGLAIYIGAWWAWARGGGAGERGLGRGAGSKHDLGLAWAHPSSRGGGGRVRPCCIHNTLHLAHSIIIKILISNIKTSRGWISSVSLPHETCRDLPCLTSGRGPPSTLRVRDQGQASGPGEIEKLGICVMWPGRPLACPVTNALRDRFLPISLLPHLISTIMCNFPNQISNHNAGTTKFLKYAWRWL